MPLVVADRVQETGTANTTVSFTLSGAVTGFQSFAVIGDTNTTYYAATDGSGNWEVGIGTYSTTGPTLTRTTILSSSNSGLAVTFSGTVNVFVTYPSGEAVYYQDTGGVVITEAGTSNALRVTNTGTGNSFVVEDTDNPDSTPFVINAQGRLLIGNTTSTAAFSGITPVLQIVGSGATGGQANNSSMSSTYRFFNDNGFGRHVFAKSRGTTTVDYTTVGNGDTLGGIDFIGADGTNFIPAALITSQVDGTPGTNDMPGRLVFSTTSDGASVPTERMRISSAGNVGIGNTISGSYKLEVTGAFYASGVIATGDISGTQTALQVDPAGTAVALAIALG